MWAEGAVERVPPPPSGIAPPSDESPHHVELITPPPLLFAEPMPLRATPPLRVPPTDIGTPDPGDSAESTVDDTVGSWRLVVAGGRTFELIRPRVLLGRDPVAKSGEQEIVVVDPTRTMSKTHALLELVDDVWRVTDLGSVNGVRLIERNGSERALVPGIPEPVSGRFSLGTVLIELRS